MPETDYRENHQMALPPGFQFDEYRLEDVLGKGGFGITYLASDSHLGTKVAIKELMPDGIATRVQTTTVVPQTNSQKDNFEWAQQRFIDEARALAKLSHTNIVRVLRLFRANGTAYMVMEYIQGQSLEDWMKELPGSPPEDDLRRYVLAILDGLEYIHNQGLFHRDIKPDNIFLRTNGEPVLIDFGSARSDLGKTMMMTSVVTHGYSPFEQYQTSSRQGPYTDFYSLAAVMFRAVTGRKPPSAIDRISDDSHVHPMLDESKRKYSPGFLAAIERAMSVKIDLRPQNAAEFRDLLGGGVNRTPGPTTTARTELVTPAPPPLPPERAKTALSPPLPMEAMPPTQRIAPAVVGGVNSVKLLAIHALLGFAMASLWIVSFFHPEGLTGAKVVPGLFDAVAAFVLPFCVLWPLVATMGRKMGTGNLYMLSMLGATGGVLLLLSCAAAVLFLQGSFYQEMGGGAFRILLIPEWILLWSAWVAREGLQGDGPEQGAVNSWKKFSVAIIGAVLACLVPPLARSMGAAHVEVLFPLCLAFFACALAILPGLGVPREVQRRQVISVRAFQNEAGVPFWAVALIAILVVLIGHQSGDFAGLAAPRTSFATMGLTWLLRVLCWVAGMGFVALAVPRRSVRLCLTGLAVVSALVPFLPSLVGYPVDGDPSHYSLGWITPLLEGILQGAFLGCIAHLTANPPPQFRMAGAMFGFIACVACGAVLSVLMGLFLDPHLASLGYVPRAIFSSSHAELWHATTWTTLAVTQSALALLLAVVIQAAVPASPKETE